VAENEKNGCSLTSCQGLSAIKAVLVAGSSLFLTNKKKTLGVALDSRLTFESQVSSVIQSCNYHAQAIRHIRDLIDQSMKAWHKS